MMFRLITGENANMLQKRLMSEVKGYLDARERQLMLIVPAQASFLIGRKIIEKCRVPGYMNVRVTTFEELTEEILRELGGRARSSVTQAGLSLLCADVISRKREELEILDIRKDPEIHMKTAELIRSVMQEDITPERLDMIAERTGGTAGLKLREVTEVYREVERRIKDLPDAQDMEALAENLCTGSEKLRESDILAYEFDVIPRRRLSFLKTMSSVTQVTLMLAGNEEDRLIRNVLRMNEGVVPEIVGKEDPDAPDDIRTLGERLFSNTVPYGEEPRNIELLMASNREEEIENIAVRILEYARDHKMSDVVLAMKDPKGYAPVIKSVFSRNGVPFFMGDRRSLIESRSADLVLTAIEIADSFQTEDIIRMIRSGFLPVTEEESSYLAAYAKTFGIKGRKFFSGFVKGDADKAEEIRKRALAPEADLIDSIRASSSAAGMCRALRRFMEDTDLDRATAERAELFLKAGLAEESEFEKQVCEKIRDVLSQMELLITEKLDPGEFAGVLRSAFSSVNISTVPPKADQVTVGDVIYGIFSDTGLTVIAGVNDGVLPSADDGDGGILLPFESRKIMEDESYFPAPPDTEEQKDHILRVIGQSGKLIFSCNASDGPESYMYDQIKRIFPKIRISEKLLPVTIGGGVRTLVREIRSGMEGGPVGILPAYLKTKEAREVVSSVLPGMILDNSPQKIPPETARLIYGGLKGSVSSIETYYGCPYRHYLDYGLRPSELADYEESAQDTGTYAHEVMETLTRSIISSKKKWAELDDAEIERYVNAAGDAILAEHNRGIMADSSRFRYLAGRLKEEIAYSARAIRDQLKDTPVNVEGSEYGFGFWNDFRIETPGGTVSVRGKIDRVDIADVGGEKYIRVVDYKTGSKRFDLTEMFYGLDIQLMVYLLALLNISKYRGAVPAGGFYFRIDLPLVDADGAERKRQQKYRMSGFLLSEQDAVNGLDNGDKTLTSMQLKKTADEDRPVEGDGALSREEMAALLKHTRDLISRAASKIYSGEIEIRPAKIGGKTVCSYCPYIAVCRSDELGCDPRVIEKMSREEIMEALER